MCLSAFFETNPISGLPSFASPTLPLTSAHEYLAGRLVWTCSWLGIYYSFGPHMGSEKGDRSSRTREIRLHGVQVAGPRRTAPICLHGWTVELVGVISSLGFLEMTPIGELSAPANLKI